jgi:hypothetical protein
VSEGGSGLVCRVHSNPLFEQGVGNDEGSHRGGDESRKQARKSEETTDIYSTDNCSQCSSPTNSGAGSPLCGTDTNSNTLGARSIEDSASASISAHPHRPLCHLRGMDCETGARGQLTDASAVQHATAAAEHGSNSNASNRERIYWRSLMTSPLTQLGCLRAQAEMFASGESVSRISRQDGTVPPAPVAMTLGATGFAENSWDVRRSINSTGQGMAVAAPGAHASGCCRRANCAACIALARGCCGCVSAVC